MAIVIPVQGDVRLCTPSTEPDWFDSDGSMTLAAMQAVVGGYIEHVHLPRPLEVVGIVFIHMVVNEEGKLHGLPINHTATALANLAGLPDFIVGDVLLLTDHEFQ